MISGRVLYGVCFYYTKGLWAVQGGGDCEKDESVIYWQKGGRRA